MANPTLFTDSSHVVWVTSNAESIHRRNPDSVGKPILFFANKRDRPDAMVCCSNVEGSVHPPATSSQDAGQVWDELGLDAIADRPLQIQ